jgi:predicted N-acyltransferase
VQVQTPLPLESGLVRVDPGGQDRHKPIAGPEQVKQESSHFRKYKLTNRIPLFVEVVGRESINISNFADVD